MSFILIVTTVTRIVMLTPAVQFVVVQESEKLTRIGREVLKQKQRSLRDGSLVVSTRNGSVL